MRIGHFAEAEVLQALEVDFIDESEVLTPADEENHIWKQISACRLFAVRAIWARLCGVFRRRGDDSHQGRGGVGQYGGGGAAHARDRREMRG